MSGGRSVPLAAKTQRGASHPLNGKYGVEESPATDFCLARLGTGHSLAGRGYDSHTGRLAPLGFHVAALLRDLCWM